MHLQRRRACANHLPSFASGVARRADGVKPPFRWRECRIAGQAPLACGLPSGSNIKDDVATTLPIEDPANGFPGPTLGKALVLEERPKGFDTRTVHFSQEATQTGAMGQSPAPKQRHESWSTGRYALKEVSERPLSTNCVAEEACEEINAFVAAEPPAH
jgi:hypothetical protein